MLSEQETGSIRDTPSPISRATDQMCVPQPEFREHSSVAKQNPDLIASGTNMRLHFLNAAVQFWTNVSGDTIGPSVSTTRIVWPFGETS
jgi:hypothetical protein